MAELRRALCAAHHSMAERRFNADFHRGWKPTLCHDRADHAPAPMVLGVGSGVILPEPMQFMTSRTALLSILVVGAIRCGTTAEAAPTAAPENRVRILILSGGGDHEWRDTTPFLRRTLTDTGRFDVRVCESPAGLTAATLGDFDAVVIDYSGLPLAGDTDHALARFVESGKGLVLTQPALQWLVTGRAASRPLLAMINASIEAVPIKGRPVSDGFMNVKFLRSDHPIAKGIKSEFKIADVVDQRLVLPSQMEVIATAGKDDPVLFTTICGKGRIFCTALGHNAPAMHAAEFKTTFARGVEWAATGDVSLPPEPGTPPPRADLVRALLIAGGHDHPAGFYSLFEGYQDVAPITVSDSGTAFQKDQRDSADVLILYDFSRDLDERGKKHLREFVESGKGLVVLHHALLNYQGWPWWYQEVVGGRYRLAPDGNTPSSTYKAGQQMFITPREHPITAGIEPFQITDETYKRMWISPRVTPLLTTDNPDSDATIAWISPYEKSRVVYIQLGHGQGSFDHPSFREIVHNALLWTAGRVK